MGSISVDQFTKVRIENNDEWLYIYLIGSRKSGSKTKKGGIKFISSLPVQIPLLDTDVLDTRLNFYKILEHLISVRPYCNVYLLFLQFNRSQTGQKTF